MTYFNELGTCDALISSPVDHMLGLAVNVCFWGKVEWQPAKKQVTSPAPDDCRKGQRGELVAAKQEMSLEEETEVHAIHHSSRFLMG